MKRIIITFYCLLIGTTVFSQFQFNGDAADLGGGSYRLTSAVNNIYGSMWHKLQHDINEPFNIQGQLYFGTQDPLGADGMAFVMHTGCLTAGTAGGGLGYKNLPGPSIAVEFDTYQNISGTGAELNNDPVEDHISVQRNGDVEHDGDADDVTPPIQMHASKANVEDGIWYDFQISYDPATFNFVVVFDGTERVNITYDLVTNVFPTNQFVYWGFTASTGGSNNLQQVALNTNFTTMGVKDTTYCTGTFPISLPSLASYSGTNLALNKIATVSSGDGNKAQALDGNMGSRWESVHGVDPQWFYVDLGSPTDVTRVEIEWETAMASAYEIQTSTDASTWTTHYSTTTNSSNSNAINFTASNVRYVRMYGTARTTGYGYSMWEFRVFGQPKYVWSPNDGTVSDIYGADVVLSPTVTTTYTLLVPAPCIGAVSLPFTVTISCPAPVEFTSFTAQKTTNGSQLHWNTSLEKDITHYEILRSIDGINFYLIGSQPVNGINNLSASYVFNDNSQFHGNVYYKIVSVNSDGTRDASIVRSIAYNTNTIVLPEPIFQNNVSLLLNGKFDYVRYSFIDMLGREIENETVQSPSEVIFLGDKLSPACYLLKIQTEANSETFRVCKVD